MPNVLTGEAANTLGLTISAASESLVASVTATAPADNATAIITGFMDLSLGTGVTSLTIRLRRGNTVGATLVQGFAGPNVTASTQVALPFYWVDQPGVVATLTYGLFVLQNAGTGVGTATQCSMGVLWITP